MARVTGSSVAPLTRARSLRHHGMTTDEKGESARYEYEHSQGAMDQPILIRPKRIWAAAFFAGGIALLAWSATRSGSVGDYVESTLLLSLGFLSVFAQWRVTPDMKVLRRSILSRRPPIDLNDLAVVSFKRRIDFPLLPPLSLTLSLRDGAGSQADMDVAFWRNWQALCTVVAHAVKQQDVQTDDATRRRLAEFD